MRCVAGDRAAIVGGFKDNIGHLVDVEEFCPAINRWTVVILGSCIARVRGQFAVLGPGSLCVISDKNLWPLRDRPGLDETMFTAGLPFDKGFRDGR